MSTITFDTLEAAQKLRDAGFDEKQAESVVRVLAGAQDNLVTSKINALRDHFDSKIDVSRVEIAHTRWMIAALFVLSIANFVIQS